MATETGVRTPNMQKATTIDYVIGNRGASTRLVAVESLAQQLLAGGPLRDALPTSGSNTIYFATKAEMEGTAIVLPPEQIGPLSAWVYADPAVENCGVYRYIPGPPAEWRRVLDLPLQWAFAFHGEGSTGDAIVASTPIPVARSVIVALPIEAENEDAEPTVAFNEGDALTIVSNSGLPIAPGGLVPPMTVWGYPDYHTGEFRLINDQVAAAIVAQAELAAASAVAAKTGAETAAHLASRFAEAPEDEEVAEGSGLFSSRHWAAKAQAAWQQLVDAVLNGIAAAINGADAKPALADADILTGTDSAAGGNPLIRFTLADLISSIFKTTRKIGNAYFNTSFRLWDATDPTKGLQFDLGALTAGQVRKIIMADGDIDLSKLAGIGGTGELTLTGNAIDILNIPASARTLTLALSGVTLSAAQQPIVLFGTSAGLVTAGYVDAAGGQAVSATSTTGLTNAMPLGYTSGGAGAFVGVVEFRRIGQSNAWSYEGAITAGHGALSNLVGNVVLADTLTRVRLTTVSGTPTFAGKASLDWR